MNEIIPYSGHFLASLSFRSRLENLVRVTFLSLQGSCLFETRKSNQHVTSWICSFFVVVRLSFSRTFFGYIYLRAIWYISLTAAEFSHCAKERSISKCFKGLCGIKKVVRLI